MLILAVIILSVASIMSYILSGSLLRDNLDRFCSVLLSLAKQQVWGISSYQDPFSPCRMWQQCCAWDYKSPAQAKSLGWDRCPWLGGRLTDAGCSRRETLCGCHCQRGELLVLSQVQAGGSRMKTPLAFSSWRLEQCRSCPLLGIVCVPHAFSRLGPVLSFSLSPQLIPILSCVVLALEKGTLYLSSVCFIHCRSSPCPPGLNLGQSQKEAALFLSPLLSPSYAALLGNTAGGEQVLFCGVTQRWEVHSLREERMPLIMSEHWLKD